MDLSSTSEIWSMVIIWDNSLECQTQRVLRLQKRFIWIIVGFKKLESCWEVFKNLQIWIFPKWYIYETVIYYWIRCKPVYNGGLHSHNIRGAVYEDFFILSTT